MSKEDLTSNEKIKLDPTVSPNKILINKHQEDSKEKIPLDSSSTPFEPIPAYHSGPVLASISNFFRLFVSPVTTTGDGSKNGFYGASNEARSGLARVSEGNNSGWSQIAVFYFYHTILTICFIFMSIYRLFEYLWNRSKLRFLNLAYSTSKTPSVIHGDINKLPKIPQRLSAILNFLPEQEEGGGIEGLCNSCSDLAAWSLSAGIPYLNIYEYHGVLKQSIPELRRAIHRKLVVYFGTNNVPTFKITVPHLNLSFYGAFDDEYDEDITTFDINISLLSNIDGRPTIVELTKVMSDLSKSGDLTEKDVTTDFIDRELEQLVGVEPDLIIVFQPFLNLQSYPPWHLRLSEMYWEPDNTDVTYAVFLRALQKFSTCKVNVGR
ncbi:unnamed protein product [Ambrosiozyma monospora]|uniref:Unnamed protein product n=1 Tax=Ambrosiozyma monospora TaxID=43982 RepID=A0ACB5TF25_AMBMO|nr:unnamed protein product [Ambrosiozyma monospora]